MCQFLWGLRIEMECYISIKHKSDLSVRNDSLNYDCNDAYLVDFFTHHGRLAVILFRFFGSNQQKRFSELIVSGKSRFKMKIGTLITMPILKAKTPSSLSHKTHSYAVDEPLNFVFRYIPQ